MKQIKKRVVQVGNLIINENDKKVLNNIIESGRISEGKYTRKFEKAWTSYIGTKYGVALNSGTSALIAVLTSLQYDKRFPKIKVGAKIITTPLTYVATVNAIKLTGMEPVFVDVSLDDYAIQPKLIKKLLESSNPNKFGAIIPVHLMGFPCDMDEINKIAKKYDFAVIEDSSQAHGSLYKNKKTGSLGLCGTYSFYIAHNIQAGELGAVVTDDKKLRTTLRQIKANGRICACAVCTRNKNRCPHKHVGDEDFDPRFTHEIVGYNFKTMEFQTAIAYSQLKLADEIMKKRQENVKYLNKKLSKHKDKFILPKYSKNVSYLAYPIIIRKESDLKRLEVRKKLDEYTIENRSFFGSIPTQQPAYLKYKNIYENKLTNSDYLGKYGFYIGVHQYLSQEDLDYIVNVFDYLF